MLKNTFVHIQGVGPKTEQKIWSSGARTWEHFLKQKQSVRPSGRQKMMRQALEISQIHLQQHNPRYFAKTLKVHQHWRLYPEFQKSLVYLDIESTGLDFDYDHITTIALYDGLQIKTYVKGQNLKAFVEDIQNYRVIVTYNGKCFDVPFIEKEFHIRLKQSHIDLRYILASLGYRGGLKNIERCMGIDRGSLSDVDGYFAVLLWRAYQKRQDPKVLETLLAYNAQDVLNLEHLMVSAYNLKLKETPFWPDGCLPRPRTAENPFQTHPEIIRSIRGF